MRVRVTTVELLQRAARCGDEPVEQLVAGMLARAALETHLMELHNCNRRDKHEARQIMRDLPQLAGSERNWVIGLLRRGNLCVHNIRPESLDTQEFATSVAKYVLQSLKGGAS
ncbi:MAG: hypothetical protein CMJ64_17650 [Planctomycetaceae bacterium]|nr:hypothetical protein [Planctomycetaceae bacterium]